MVAHPEVQQRAHEEMDRVVGEHRMPTLEDLEHMPYIRAMILEVSSIRRSLTNRSSILPQGPSIPPGLSIACTSRNNNCR